MPPAIAGRTGAPGSAFAAPPELPSGNSTASAAVASRTVTSRTKAGTVSTKKAISS